MYKGTERQLIKHDWDAAWLLFLGGATLDRIAKLLEIPFRIVEQHSGRHQWKERRTRALANARQSTVKDLQERMERQKIRHQHFMLNELEKTEITIEDTQAALNPDPEDNRQITLERKMGLLDKQDMIARRVLGLDKDDKSDPTQTGFAMLVAISRAHAESKRLEYTAETLVNESQEQETVAQKDEPKDAEWTPENTSPLPSSTDEPRGPLLGILRSGNALIESEHTPILPPESPEIREAGGHQQEAGQNGEHQNEEEVRTSIPIRIRFNSEE